MKLNVQRLLSLLFVLCICVGTVLSGCTPSGGASVGTGAPEPETEQSSEPEPRPEKEVPEQAAQTRKIEKTAETPVQADWTEQSGYRMDFDGDGEKERVSLYISTQRDEEGNLALDDGQEWVLSVEQGGRFYTLFDERVQNGNVYFEVSDYYEGAESVPTITLIQSAGAGFRLIRYTYDKTDSAFEEEVLYDSSDDSTDGINLRYSSIPDAK